MLRRIACEGKEDIASDDLLGDLHSSVGFHKPLSLSGSKLPPDMIRVRSRDQFKRENRRYFKEVASKFIECDVKVDGVRYFKN